MQCSSIKDKNLFLSVVDTPIVTWPTVKPAVRESIASKCSIPGKGYITDKHNRFFALTLYTNLRMSIENKLLGDKDITYYQSGISYKYLKELVNMDFNKFQQLVELTILQYNVLIYNHGIKVGTSIWKKVTKYVEELFEKGFSNLNPERKLVEIDYVNFPSMFLHLFTLFKCNDYKDIQKELTQCIKSLVNIHKAVADYSELDLEPIKKTTFLKKSSLKRFREYVQGRLTNDIILQADRKDWKLQAKANISKSGPNAGPKLDTGPAEASALINAVRHETIGNAFKRLCLATNNEAFLSYVQLNAELHDTATLEKGGHIEPSRLKAHKDRLKQKVILQQKLKRTVLTEDDKLNDKRTMKKSLINHRSDLLIKRSRVPLSFYKRGHGFRLMNLEDVSLRVLNSIKSPGNKSRTIATGDLWSQILLKGLEEKILEVIQDNFHGCNFIHNHDDGFKASIRKMKPRYDSLDVSQWTDTFSAQLQFVVMEEIFGQEIAESWWDLAVRCNWDYFKGKNLQSPVKYGTGQGMGLHSSFQIATLTSHFLVEMLLCESYPEMVETHGVQELYTIVGDDLTVYNSSNIFLNGYVKEFKMSINETKSKINDGIFNSGILEFVSQSVSNNEVVSPVSLRLSKQADKSPYALSGFLVHLRSRIFHDGFLNQLLKNAINYRIWPKNQYVVNFIGAMKIKNILSPDVNSQAFVESGEYVCTDENSLRVIPALGDLKSLDFVDFLWNINNLWVMAYQYLLKSKIDLSMRLMTREISPIQEEFVETNLKLYEVPWSTGTCVGTTFAHTSLYNEELKLTFFRNEISDAIKDGVFQAGSIEESINLIFDMIREIERFSEMITFSSWELDPTERANRSTSKYLRYFNSIIWEVDNYEVKQLKLKEASNSVLKDLVISNEQPEWLNELIVFHFGDNVEVDKTPFTLRAR